MQKQKNLLLFIVLAILVTYTWMTIRDRFFPAPKPVKPEETAAAKIEKTEGAKSAESRLVQIPAPPPVTPQDKLLRLGSRVGEGSRFHLGVELDPRGAGVRSVVLNKFKAADDMGRPTADPLELVPGEANRHSPSYLLYAYDVKDPNDDKPFDTLGRALWQVVGEPNQPIAEDTLADGRKRQRVSFQAEAQGFLITKTFTLTESEYHLGLEIKLARKPGVENKDLRLRYQLTGAHGLPIEGKWYTGTFRNALIAAVNDRGSVNRDLQDLRQLTMWEGGNEVRKEPGFPLRYACAADQFFAAGVVVDDDQQSQDFLSFARPTLETSVTKGQVQSIIREDLIDKIAGLLSLPAAAQTIPTDIDHFVLLTPDRLRQAYYVQEADRLRFASLAKGMPIAVIHHSASYNDQLKAYPQVATDWRDEGTTHALWENDVTVRVTTEPIDVRPGEEVVHKYLLYHGPVKVSQLYGAENVSSELVDRYHDRLHLNTLTDYHSPGWFGTFASSIGFSSLVIWFTNVMHSVLGIIHKVVPSYGLCIILLTVLVRGLMFPVSRKQQMMTFKMQQLAPELKKLQEKHKDDRQAMGMAQMELYRKHGVNPFGSCWFLLLQMPIFMGLYFALQESIHFRLATFWPTWIVNLAAPDMMLYWGQKIPWISRPQDYGGFLFLGPYFNLLPVIAVVLMIFQQKMLTPPPTDDQQAFQMKIMRFMMIFMGLMFYKVAAGLCIYFIASSVWGFAERKLLPRYKPNTGGPISSEGLFQRMLSGSASAQPATVPAGAGPSNTVQPGGSVPSMPAGDRGRRREKQRTRRRPERVDGSAEEGGGGLGGWWRERRRRFREWWAELLEQARKK